MDEQKNKRIETVIAWVCSSITLIFDRADYSFHHHGAATDLRDARKRLATLANCHREIAKKKPRMAEAFSLLCGR
jgi:nitrate/TMAO reductase-like tetraheme cytochrome c subunit